MITYVHIIYHGHQNPSKCWCLFLTNFHHVHMWCQNWHQYLWTSLWTSFLWTSSIVKMFDCLTFDIFWTSLTPFFDNLISFCSKYPSFIKVIGYIFHFGGIICGPAFFFKDYMEFISGKNFEYNEEFLCRYVIVFFQERFTSKMIWFTWKRNQFNRGFSKG